MSTIDRALLALYSFLMGIFSVYLVILSTGIAGIRNLVDFVLDNRDQRVALGALAVILFLISVKLFIASVQKVKTINSTVVQETSLGQIRVTLEALENMVRRAVHQVRGIREITPHIVCEPGGITVLIRAIVTPDTQIPPITEEIQDRVKAYLYEVAGISVNTVKILVENVSTDVRSRVE